MSKECPKCNVPLHAVFKCPKCGEQWRNLLAELPDICSQLAQAKARISELEAHGCEMVERAMVDSEAFRKDIVELKARVIRVCASCGGLMTGRLDQPCCKCDSLEGELVETAWFKVQAENESLRGVWVDLAESRKTLAGLLTAFKPDMDPDEYGALESVADAMDDAMKAYKPEWREEWYRRVLARGELRLENNKLQERIASLTKPEPRYNGMTLSTLTAVVDALLEVAGEIDNANVVAGPDCYMGEITAGRVRDKADALRAIKPETTP